MGTKETSNLAIVCLGSAGRLLSGSKGQYRFDNPKNFILFNANIFITELVGPTNEINTHKIWFGDLDITLDWPKLLKLSKESNKHLWILSEMDGRFENEKNPDLINNYSVFIDADAKLNLIDSVLLNHKLLNYCEYKDNKILLKSRKPSKKTREVFEYNAKDFELISLLPASSFRAAGKKDTECPYFKFFDWVAKKLDKPTKEVECSTIYVHPKFEKKLKVLTRTWLKKFHRLEGYKLQSELNWLAFDISPATFSGMPDWANQNGVYLKVK